MTRQGVTTSVVRVWPMFVLLVSGMAVVSCSRGGGEQERAEEAAASVVGAAGDEARAAARAGASADGDDAEEAAGPMDRWQEPAPQPAPSPDEVMEALESLGWEVASQLQTERFAPMPPGAEARAARMRRGDAELGVAVFRYPNPGFALPHVVDLRERIAVLPQAREALVRAGRTVIHLEGPDGASVATWARQVAERLEVELASEDIPAAGR